MLVSEHLKKMKEAMGKLHILASESSLMAEILRGIDLDIAALEKAEKEAEANDHISG